MDALGDHRESDKQPDDENSDQGCSPLPGKPIMESLEGFGFGFVGPSEPHNTRFSLDKVPNEAVQGENSNSGLRDLQISRASL